MLQTSAIFWLSSTQIPSLLSWNNPLYELSEPFHLWTLRDLTLSSYSLLVRIYTNDIWMLIIFSSSLKQMMGEWRPLRNFSQWWWGSQGQDIVDLIPAALWANLVAVAWTKSHSSYTVSVVKHCFQLLCSFSHSSISNSVLWVKGPQMFFLHNTITFL